jgi:hypothetical protein
MVFLISFEPLFHLISNDDQPSWPTVAVGVYTVREYSISDVG